MNRENILVSWINWHFIQTPKFLLSVWDNYLFFGSNYFSIPLLLSTLFSPWKRYSWRYGKNFRLGEYLSVFVTNIFSRLMGFLCRVVLILAGITMQMVIVIVGALAIIFWLAIPLIIIFLVVLLFYGI